MEKLKKEQSRLLTLNMVPGQTVYGEKKAKIDGKEYRIWDPTRSKLGAAIVKGLKINPFIEGINVLYLGSANGTTVSHISDLLGKNDKIYCLEIASWSMADLIKLAETRPNIYPILADARMPEEYAKMIDEKVDVLFEDVADREQARILIENSKLLLKKYGLAMIAIKARSINAVENPRVVYDQVVKELTQKEFELLQRIDLHPFEKDHVFLVLKKK
ncbi:Fibrillarin-like rRNA/tRNA 2'-O-methyltransferase [uncultured archaeon]|nr:Fibrillarin-like rRNA/tRNA 2'-O-methyltransferase [uncultured archaeon]